MISHLKALVKSFKNQELKWKKLHPQYDKTDFNQKKPLLVRASFRILWIEMFQFSLLLSFGNALGFPKRYTTTSYLKGLRNGSWSKLEAEKNL